MTRRSRSTKAAANNTNNPSSEIPRGATSRWPNTAVIASVAVGAAASVAAGISFTTQGQGGLDTRGLTHVFASLSGSSVGPAASALGSSNTAIPSTDTAVRPRDPTPLGSVDADTHAAAVNDWHERWHDGRIGFHLPRTHRLLMKHKNSLLGEGVTSPPELSKRVFVPLCGKAVDMLWLAACGHRAKGKMIFLPKFSVDQIIKFLPKATSMMGVPTFYTRLLSDGRFTKNLTKHMRLFVSGSAPLLSETHRAFETRTGHRILERYGMTETTMNTSNPYDGERRAGTVGFPLPGVEARITDEKTGAILKSNEIGILEVRGPNVFKGYWRMPEKTKTEFRDDGFFITGDIAQIDSEGYVAIVGRAKDLIISGGYNVYPKEIEIKIDALENVMESAVIGAPHPDFGEAVIAVVVCVEGKTTTAEKVQTALQVDLAKFKCPKAVFFLDELPRNTMGKVQKNGLRNQFEKTFQKNQ